MLQLQAVQTLLWGKSCDSWSASSERVTHALLLHASTQCRTDYLPTCGPFPAQLDVWVSCMLSCCMGISTQCALPGSRTHSKGTCWHLPNSIRQACTWCWCMCPAWQHSVHRWVGKIKLVKLPPSIILCMLLLHGHPQEKVPNSCQRGTSSAAGRPTQQIKFEINLHAQQLMNERIGRVADLLCCSAQIVCIVSSQSALCFQYQHPASLQLQVPHFIYATVKTVILLRAQCWSWKPFTCCTSRSTVYYRTWCCIAVDCSLALRTLHCKQFQLLIERQVGFLTWFL